MEIQKKSSWLERVEEIIGALEGSTVSEFELTEEGTQITIRRATNMVLTAVPTVEAATGPAIVPAAGTKGKSAASKVDKSIPVVAPLTGVYYSSASPSTPPFVNIGDTVQVGQVVALIEAMKVFNEINSEVSGRVVAIPAKNGDVIQKGDAILRIEPL
jgi:acetyl-CoA carboxylase biotin carboxyl carrier protein